ncbi:hypothetical protein D3C76_1732920 [compost metagenome]
MALAAEIHTDDIDPVDKRKGAVIRNRVEGAVDVQYAASSRTVPAVSTSASSNQFTAYIARKGLFAIRA